MNSTQHSPSAPSRDFVFSIRLDPDRHRRLRSVMAAYNIRKLAEGVRLLLDQGFAAISIHGVQPVNPSPAPAHPVGRSPLGGPR